MIDLTEWTDVIDQIYLIRLTRPDLTWPDLTDGMTDWLID